jgi:hypothetical protein
MDDIVAVFPHGNGMGVWLDGIGAMIPISFLRAKGVRSLSSLCVINDYLVGKNWNYPKDWCCTWKPIEAGPRL